MDRRRQYWRALSRFDSLPFSSWVSRDRFIFIWCTSRHRNSTFSPTMKITTPPTRSSPRIRNRALASAVAAAASSGMTPSALFSTNAAASVQQQQSAAAAATATSTSGNATADVSRSTATASSYPTAPHQPPSTSTASTRNNVAPPQLIPPSMPPLPEIDPAEMERRKRSALAYAMGDTSSSSSGRYKRSQKKHHAASASSRSSSRSTTPVNHHNHGNGIPMGNPYLVAQHQQRLQQHQSMGYGGSTNGVGIPLYTNDTVGYYVQPPPVQSSLPQHPPPRPLVSVGKGVGVECVGGVGSITPG